MDCTWVFVDVFVFKCIYKVELQIITSCLCWIVRTRKFQRSWYQIVVIKRWWCIALPLLLLLRSWGCCQGNCTDAFMEGIVCCWNRNWGWWKFPLCFSGLLRFININGSRNNGRRGSDINGFSLCWWPLSCWCGSGEKCTGSMIKLGIRSLSCEEIITYLNWGIIKSSKIKKLNFVVKIIPFGIEYRSMASASSSTPIISAKHSFKISSFSRWTFVYKILKYKYCCVTLSITSSWGFCLLLIAWKWCLIVPAFAFSEIRLSVVRNSTEFQYLNLKGVF